MADLNTAKIGMADVRDIIPKGREVYWAARDHVNNPPTEINLYNSSSAVNLLGRVVKEHFTMVPPLPEEVVHTITDFEAQYQQYLGGEGRGRNSRERLRMEGVADQLVSIVFEYGYGNLPPAPAQ